MLPASAFHMTAMPITEHFTVTATGTLGHFLWIVLLSRSTEARTQPDNLSDEIRPSSYQCTICCWIGNLSCICRWSGNRRGWPCSSTCHRVLSNVPPLARAHILIYRALPCENMCPAARARSLSLELPSPHRKTSLTFDDVVLQHLSMRPTAELVPPASSH